MTAEGPLSDLSEIETSREAVVSNVPAEQRGLSYLASRDPCVLLHVKPVPTLETARLGHQSRWCLLLPKHSAQVPSRKRARHRECELIIPSYETFPEDGTGAAADPPRASALFRRLHICGEGLTSFDRAMTFSRTPASQPNPNLPFTSERLKICETFPQPIPKDTKPPVDRPGSGSGSSSAPARPLGSQLVCSRVYEVSDCPSVDTSCLSWSQRQFLEHNIGTLTTGDTTAVSKIPCGTQCGVWLVNCNITTIEAEAFRKVPQVKTLVIWRNNLPVLRSGTFEGMEGLEQLLLLDNNLAYLEAGTFEGLPMLRELRLVDNHIVTTIHPDVWRGLQLEGLDAAGYFAVCIYSGKRVSRFIPGNRSVEVETKLNAEGWFKCKTSDRARNHTTSSNTTRQNTAPSGKSDHNKDMRFVVFAAICGLLLVISIVWCLKEGICLTVENNDVIEDHDSLNETDIGPYAEGRIEDHDSLNETDIGPYAEGRIEDHDSLNETDIGPYAEGRIEDHDSLNETDIGPYAEGRIEDHDSLNETDIGPYAEGRIEDHDSLDETYIGPYAEGRIEDHDSLNETDIGPYTEGRIEDHDSFNETDVKGRVEDCESQCETGAFGSLKTAPFEQWALNKTYIERGDSDNVIGENVCDATCYNLTDITSVVEGTLANIHDQHDPD
ncbi:hypothetical protein Bbelb_267910 [Branchiostoma belcheri]|nr:hypothetical protein Bbelb_267910 [Branchiostoma belcheri]